jgi:hypothetical protein
MQTIQAIADATGLPTSSVHRHQQAIARRNQYPESGWWETEVGGTWLKRLVLAVVYHFGIKQGVGGESLSAFFQAIHLETHVGISASALRRLQQEMKQAIIAYEAAQSTQCQPPGPTGICVGGDETFFDLPILVLMELASGFILTEVECENRTYETWSAQIQRWWSQGGWQCHFLVSDGAKALIKLALSGLGCASVADLFHALRALSQPMGRAIGRQFSRVRQQQATVQQQDAKTTNEAKRQELQHAIETLEQEQQVLEQAQATYHQAIHAITQTIHPFNIDTGDWQICSDLSHGLQAPLDTLSALAPIYGASKAQTAIDTFRSQIPALAQGVHAWWQWTNATLSAKTDNPDLQNWVITDLLPWVYWHQQADKTRQPQLKHRYQQATEQAYARLAQHPMTQQMDDLQHQDWISWAQWMCAKYQRTSSAVEGRNGYLSRLHHAQRGFSEQTLRVLTIIHNFDLKRTDGTTAAQRLFGQPFPDLFEWVVDHMGELPRPRKSSKAHQLNPLSTKAFPA